MLKINNLQRFCSSILGWKLGFCALFCVILTLAPFGIIACGADSHERQGKKNALPCADTVLFEPMQYSGMFRLGTSCGVDFAEIKSIVGRDTLTKRFAFVDSLKLSGRGLSLGQLVQGRGWKNAMILQVPLRRVVALSSSQIGYMLKLGVSNRIVGIGDAKYVVDSVLFLRASSLASRASNLEPITELGNGSSLDYEKLIALKPDLVMTFATGGSEDDYASLSALGIPVMLTSEWQESHPLSKMEWIKLYGKMLCGADSSGICSHSADSVFEQSRKKYEGFAFSAQSVHGDSSLECVPTAPRVLAGMSYGGVWYAPGGKSYTAQLIRDAGGCYLFASDTSRELKLSLEEVFLLSDSADVWINPGAFSKPGDLLAVDPRVKKIRAFREKRVFQNDGVLGPGGGNDFYESAVVKPYELLENLSKCLKNGREMCESSKKCGKNEYLKDTSYMWYKNIFNF